MPVFSFCYLIHQRPKHKLKVMTMTVPKSIFSRLNMNTVYVSGNSNILPKRKFSLNVDCVLDLNHVFYIKAV